MLIIDLFMKIGSFHLRNGRCGDVGRSLLLCVLLHLFLPSHFVPPPINTLATLTLSNSARLNLQNLSIAIGKIRLCELFRLINSTFTFTIFVCVVSSSRVSLLLKLDPPSLSRAYASLQLISLSSSNRLHE